MDLDHGREFDFGRTSEMYARYRDIYPPAFFRPLLDRGLCVRGQAVLDLGTGTGVLPRSLYSYGAAFTGIDSSANQIEQAKALAKKGRMRIRFLCTPAESCVFPGERFDVVTACQCFAYFDHAVLAPRLSDLLQPGGRLAVLYMAWLPEEDPVAGRSEELILRYHPGWTGAGERRRPNPVPEAYQPYFKVEAEEVFDLAVPFTRESWNGRILSCRGVGASLPAGEVRRFEAEHRRLLEAVAPPAFSVRHYAAVTVLQKR